MTGKPKPQRSAAAGDGMIDWRELLSMMVVYTVAKIFLVGPERFGRSVQTGTLIVIALMMMVTPLWFYPLILVLRAFPGQNAVEITRRLLGRIGAYVFAIPLSIALVGLLATALRELTDALITAVIPRSGSDTVLVTLILTALYFALQNTETLGRLSLVSACVFLPAVLALVIASVPLWSPNGLFPIFGPGLSKIGLAALMRQSAYLELGVIAIFAARLKKPEHVSRAGWGGFLLSNLLIFSVVLCTQMVLPYPSIAHSSAPFLRVAKTATFGQFPQRLDPLLMIAWLGIGLLYISVGLRACGHIVTSLFNGIGLKKVIVVLAAVTVLLARSFSTFATTAIWDWDILRPACVPFIFGWTWLLFVLMRLKKRQVGGARQ